MSEQDFKVKRVPRSEVQGDKSWWSQPANLILLLVLSLLTVAAIYIASALLGPADEAARVDRFDRTGTQEEPVGAPGVPLQGVDETGETGAVNEADAATDAADAATGAAVADPASCQVADDLLTAALPEPSGTLPNGAPQWSEPFPTLIDAERDYVATLETTRGPVVIDLLEDESPLAVNNFVALAASGFYDGTPFHRVLDGFMAQGGDPTGTGRGGPGYQFDNETADLSFDGPGVVGMANSGPDTNGSQFFITFAPATHLDGGYTIFGEVIEGQENVDALTRINPEQPQADVTPDAIQCVSVSAQ